MTSPKPAPFERAYWADPGRLMGGCYPGDKDPAEADRKLRGLLDCGIRTMVNLMEPDESGHGGARFVPYEDRFAALAEGLAVQVSCVRHAVRDLSVPSADGMRAIQQAIDESVARGRPVYVHCWGGRGRTGTAVGVYLVRRGLATADDFVEVIRKLRAGDAGGGESPETTAQIAFVRDYLRRR